jgi:nicotinamide-nucleotide amidase
VSFRYRLFLSASSWTRASTSMTRLASQIHELGERLRLLQLRLAVAESLTAGKLQDAVVQLSGASDFFCGGITTYSLQSKIRILNCSPELVRIHQGVHPRIVQQMAAGVAALFQADIAVATTGFAEPSADGAIATPFAWIAIADIRQTRVQDAIPWEGKGGREDVRKAVTRYAIECILRHLQGTE